MFLDREMRLTASVTPKWSKRWDGWTYLKTINIDNYQMRSISFNHWEKVLAHSTATVRTIDKTGQISNDKTKFITIFSVERRAQLINYNSFFFINFSYILIYQSWKMNNKIKPET